MTNEERYRKALEEIKEVAHGCCVCDEAWDIASLALMSDEDREAELELRKECG